MSDLRTSRLAVLIDADNASPKIAEGLFEEIAAIGEASVRRIYGDFSHTRSKGWTEILPKYAIMPHQQFAYTTGKNASDVAMVIDAMDLLHSASGSRAWTSTASASRRRRRVSARPAAASSIPRT